MCLIYLFLIISNYSTSDMEKLLMEYDYKKKSTYTNK